MIDSDAFGELHPAVGFAFFAAVLAISMTVSHPVVLMISLVSGLCYLFYAFHGEFFPTLKLALPLAILGAVINPLFSHEGATILAYFPSGNPLTLESIICGVSSALTLSSTIIWFSAARKVLTTDKFVWLFGRIAPALSLVFSMTLRSVPRFIGRLREAYAAEGLLHPAKKPIERTKLALNVISGSINWAIESSVNSADSMKSRGYGLPGRTAYTNYYFGRRDRLSLAIICGVGAFAISGELAGGFYFRFYPTVKSVGAGRFQTAFFAGFLALSVFPLIFDIVADRRWK